MWMAFVCLSIMATSIRKHRNHSSIRFFHTVLLGTQSPSGRTVNSACLAVIYEYGTIVSTTFDNCESGVVTGQSIIQNPRSHL